MTVTTLLLFLLLLLLLDSQANHFYGTVMTFTPKERTYNGSLTVVFHYKLSFRKCTDQDTWNCVSSDCGTESVELNIVDEEDKGWCQREGIMTREVSSNTSFFQLRLDGGDWIKTKNKVVKWKAVTNVDLRTRLDTSQPNKSPQTTILPILRVPSNCQRDFSLLAFDPDGDKVKCRYGDADMDECNPCAPPAFLTTSQACTLSFYSASRPDEGSYAVQLEMEDFPKQTVIIGQFDTQTSITPRDALSKIPIRFTLMVDPPAPSCSEGVYLPKFLPPTPANGARLYTNETVNIAIKAEATNAMILKLMFSGPHGVVKRTVSHGEFILTWTPSESEDGEDHPICFVVQAEENTTKYHSELRCVIVSFRTEPITTTLPPTTVPPTTLLPTTVPRTTVPPTTLPPTTVPPTTVPPTTVPPTTVPPTTVPPTTVPPTTVPPTTVLPSTTPESTSAPPFVTEPEPLNTETIVLDEAKGSGDDSSHAGKIAGAVCGAVGVVTIAGIAVWVWKGSPNVLYKVV